MKHLIHIGLPKAGSTYLQHWFAAHPQIHYRPGGFGGFFTIFEMARYCALEQPPVAYCATSAEALTAPRLTTGRKLFFSHETDARYDLLKAQERVRDILKILYPDSTILIVTRGFNSLVFSHYSQFVREGTDLDFADWAKQSSLYKWDFNHLIGLYRTAFSQRNVIVLPYELLASDPSTFLRELEARLDLDHHEFPPTRINPALTNAEMVWYPRLSRIIKKLPFGKLIHGRIFVPIAFFNALALLIRILDKIIPSRSLNRDMLPQELTIQFRGRASILEDDDLFAPFNAEYNIHEK